MRADRFLELLTTKGPFASVCFDDSHDTENARQEFDLRWREIRERLVAEGAGEDVLSVLDKAVYSSAPPVGRSGRALVANAERVWIDEALAYPPERATARYAAAPFVMDVVQLGFPRAYYGVVAVDHEGADLTIHNARGEVVDSETVTGDQYPIHKARSADTDQWGDAENRTDEARKRNIAEVADRVTKRLDAATADGSKVAPFFVIGEVRARSQLLSALPERARAVSFELERGSRAAGAKTVEVRTAIDEEITVRRAGVVGDAADRWNAEKGRASGLAVEGIADVTRALREQAVDTLIVGDVGERTVVVGDEPSWVAPDADTLSEFGASDEEVRLADEALPFAAIAGRSVLIGADPRIEPVDGFAAILRHALP